MLIQDIIRKKRAGLPLGNAEIEAFVQGIVDESISDSQISAFAMATYFTDMQTQECVALTQAMKDSGTTLTWDTLNLPGPVVDKHSSGGVGDKVSLMLAPMLASCGVFVPMISGRGLEHTGGTLDKLESIPGYNIAPDVARFQSIVKEVGCAIVGQTADLAPADKRFYAIRDMTATVESLPLITASILSKKLSAGLDCLVIDVKTGNGAFADSLASAADLAYRIVTVSGGLRLPRVALITDMSQVLGASAGNAVEVTEVIDYLNGNQRDPRLHEVVVALGSELLLLAEIVEDLQQGYDALNKKLDDGTAAETFARMVSASGGPNNLLQHPETYLPRAAVICPVYPTRAGKVSAIDVRSVGNAIIELGGGRRVATDGIDHSVGLTEIRGLGESVDSENPIAMIHARDQASADIAAGELRAAFTLAESASKASPVILKRVQQD